MFPAGFGSKSDALRKSIFHEDWWLNALAPGRWREVTCLRGGRVAKYLRLSNAAKVG